MDQLIASLAVFIVFGTIIAIHELGHFIVAKLSGMTVHEFALGFGPVLFSRKKNGTQYAIRAFPLGGFVRIAGMEPGEEHEPNGFYTKPFLPKFLTIFAGAFMNFVLALILLIILGMAVGKPTGTPVIRKVMPNTPAALAGLQRNDVVVKVADIEQPTVSEMIEAIGTTHPPVTMVVLRDGQSVALSITPKPMKGQATPKIGVELGTTYEKISAGESVKQGVISIVGMVRATVIGLGKIITGQVPLSSLVGIVGAGRVIHEAAQSTVGSGGVLNPEGLSYFLVLFAAISMSIGFFNLLPIPALDGSHLAVIVIEQIRGRPFNPEKKALVHMVGFALLLVLMVLILGNDILTWIRGKSPLGG